MPEPISLKNQVYTGASDRSSLYDIETPANWNGKLVIFIHGYMGYKDWGCWNLVQDYFVQQDFSFLKYNVSHNGGTVENPIDFDDLKAFAQNSYSKEIKDFEAILDLVSATSEEEPEIHLIGHSRGGGIALLQSKHPKIARICSWAGISSIGSRFPKGNDLSQWESNGVRYGKNGRTKQDMPHSFDQYLDYVANIDRLDIETYCKSSTTPTLIVHGDADPSVKIDEGKTLASWLNTELQIITDTQHTFDASQPWNSKEMPRALREVCDITLNFLIE
jgi:pimeloyl-ACP methyl ester carboxylesterase